MENASHALFIAISVLIAIMIISLILFGWRVIGSVEKSRDDVVAVKNKTAFNAEFEVYDKPLMYGTDVLSCLNKAQNNNQRYVYNNYYNTGNTDKNAREEFFIDVAVTIYGDLYDTVKAYYKDKNGRYQTVFNFGNIVAANYNDTVFNYDNTKYTFNIPKIYYYYFQGGKLYQGVDDYINIMWKSPYSKNTTLSSAIQAGQIKTNITGASTGTTYHLLTNIDTTKSSTSSSGGITDSARLSALLSTVNLKELLVENRTQPTAIDESDWWYCTWTTAASDFKSRKFKCIGVSYNSENGYIEKLEFDQVR